MSEINGSSFMKSVQKRFHKIWKQYMTRRKILFITPSYFSTYFLQNSLRKLGYHADTYVFWSYPDSFLWYKPNEMIRPIFDSKNKLLILIDNIRRMYLCVTSECVFSLGNVIGGRWGHIICKIFGRKQMCVLTSCALEARMSTWIKVGNGRLCDNCGLRLNKKNYCNDLESDKRLVDRKNYSIGEVSSGAIPFSEAPNEKPIPFFCCDKNYFNPKIEIPDSYKIKKKKDFIYIIHSYAEDKDRLNNDGINPIKGTPAILSAIHRLKEEGYNIELINPSKIDQMHMRFLQVQADFCVDELLYGWWGCTPLECAALGIPTIVYLDPNFLAHWKKNFPQLSELIPFLSATKETVYDTIKVLCDNPSLRFDLSKKSKEFAAIFLDPDKNAQNIIDIINET